MLNLTKAQVKAITALHHKKERDSQGLYLAEGAKLILDLILAGARVNALYCSEESAMSAHEAALILPQHQVAKLSQFKTPADAIAIFYKHEEITLKQCSGSVIYLQDLQDPGNMGTIIRTADWFGVQHVVCSAYCTDAYGAKAVQASMGSIARVRIHKAELHDLKLAMPASTMCYAATMDGSSLYDTKPAPNYILVIGSEGQGINVQHLPKDTEMVTIPRKGGAESLNAAIAAGVILGYWNR
jgi:RNA methyltransferase, TrmH family